ncbi:MAG: FtsX-like permease family protein [Oscillospiraceae bacterium]|jgi:putative ABC transport system permease protein|nr:FtsX-like permease family protein [Oscillospiraceae bacterium]
MNVFTLAVRNVRKSFKDYGIYFLTVALGVAIFYVFNSIASQSVMMEIDKQLYDSLKGISTVMDMLSFLVAAIFGFLILYANAFILRRRKNELGLYTILGMSKIKISAVLTCETLLVGVISLAAGLALGVCLSQGMALVTAKLLGVSVVRFAFVFSGDAMAKSIRCFAIAFLIVILFSVVNLNTRKLLDLLYADKKNAQLLKLPLWVSAAVFMVSVSSIATAYYLVLNTGLVNFFTGSATAAFCGSIVLGTAGTFMFFFSLSGFLLKLISKLNGIYFKRLNMFTLKQLNRKIHTAWVSMSFVCLMLFMAISAISVGSSLAAAIRAYRADELTTSIAVSYTTTYLGIVFLISCAVVLTIAQLSEASDNHTRYRLLSKLGADHKALAGSVFQQVSIYFAAPLMLAVIHSVVGIKAMSIFAEALGSRNIFAMSLTSGGAIVLIYGGYFLVTYFNAKKIALR